MLARAAWILAFTLPAAAAPTVTSVSPSSGPVGGRTIVTVRGTGFVRGAAVTFGGYPSNDVTVIDSTLITLRTLPHPAATVDVTVFNPDRTSGTLPHAFTFEELPGGSGRTLTVPIVVSASGLNGAFYTSELTLANRGTTDVTLTFRYRQVFGGGDGTGSDTLAAGRQIIVRDAIAYLISRGVAIPPTGDRAGTLRVTFSGLSSETAAAATVRTTTAVSNGVAGLAYPALPPAGLLTESSYVFGLRQDASDRSNVAILNAGGDTDGNVTLRVTVFSGDPDLPAEHALDALVLIPGELRQYTEILKMAGAQVANGYVRIDRVSGTSPYYAYGVLADQVNSDGSFLAPVVPSAAAGRPGLTVPAVVSAGPYTTELYASNFTDHAETVRLSYVADAIQVPDKTARFTIVLQPREQAVIPDVVAFLRRIGAPGLESTSASYAGALFASVDDSDVSGVFLGARTSAPGGGGRFGVFYAGVPFAAVAAEDAWLYGLQQDSQSRTNIALVNTGDADGDTDSFRIDLYDGENGALVGSVPGIEAPQFHWSQLNSLVATYAPEAKYAYAHIILIGGDSPWIAYAVVNDGSAQGLRSDDGAFVSAQPGD